MTDIVSLPAETFDLGASLSSILSGPGQLDEAPESPGSVDFAPALSGQDYLEPQRLSTPQRVDWEKVGSLDPSEGQTAKYNGRVRVAFSPCPDSAMLGVLWEAMRRVVGSDEIATAQPTAGGRSYEFVLELGDAEMDPEDLRRRFPQAQMTKEGQQRLHITWA